MCLLRILQELSLYDNHFAIIVTSRHENHLRTNKQLTNLLYTDVKNLSSVLNCNIGPNCVFLGYYKRFIFDIILFL